MQNSRRGFFVLAGIFMGLYSVGLLYTSVALKQFPEPIVPMKDKTVFLFFMAVAVTLFFGYSSEKRCIFCGKHLFLPIGAEHFICSLLHPKLSLKGWWFWVTRQRTKRGIIEIIIKKLYPGGAIPLSILAMFVVWFGISIFSVLFQIIIPREDMVVWLFHFSLSLLYLSIILMAQDKVSLGRGVFEKEYYILAKFCLGFFAFLHLLFGIGILLHRI